MNQRDRIEQVILTLSEAALDDSRWPTAASLLDEACGVTSSSLVGAESTEAGMAVMFARFCRDGQRNQELEREYFDDYYPRDERLPRIKRLADNRLVRVTDLLTAPELKTSPVYNEFLRRKGGQNGLLVRMAGPRGLKITWSLSDPVARGDWGSEQMQTVRALLPHIRHFVGVRQALADAGASVASMTGLLDSVKVGVLHLDRRGRVSEMNDYARATLGRKRSGLAIRSGFLRAWLPSDDAALQRLLAGALPAAGAAACGGSMTVRKDSSLASLALHVSPVNTPRFDFGPLKVRARVLIVPVRDVATVDAQGSAYPSPSHLAAALGLDATESRITALLVQGKTVREAANALDLKETTVRWYLRRIFRKLGVSRQVELVRLGLLLSGSGNSGA